MDWWNKKETLQKLQQFHEDYARQPNIRNIRGYHNEIITRIRNQLQRDKQCLRLEFSGSAYEGVQIGPDVEFDVMFVINGNDLEISKSQSKEHFFLKAKAGYVWGVDSRYEKYIESTSHRELIPKKVRSIYFSVFQHTIRKLDLHYEITLLEHGPAIQMTVRSPYGTYDVDMVPCFEVGGNFIYNALVGPRQFVAKPLCLETHLEKEHLLWRESFSKEETAFFYSLDKDNGCRKKVIRILKAIRQHDSSLKRLNSYHFKTALMKLCERDNSSYTWKQQHLVLRVMDILGYLEECLKGQRLDHKYFESSVNLFRNMSEGTFTTMYNRIRRIRACEHIFLGVISSRRTPHNSDECNTCQSADGKGSCSIL